LHGILTRCGLRVVRLDVESAFEIETFFGQEYAKLYG
jgi:hypothetical protein